jgi:glycosyltransferase involved in cell wall biosynthesis
VLLVTPQPFYEDRGTPIAVAHTARALGELGYTVDLLAFPFGRHIELPHVNTHRCGNPLGLETVPIGFSWQKCALDASLIRSFEHLLKSRRYDIVHAVEEAAYIASRICHRAGRRFIYDMASSIPAELSCKPLLRSGVAQRLLRSVESSVIKRAAHVICSSGLGETVRGHSHDTPTAEWRFPAVSGTADAALMSDIRMTQQISPADKVVVYSGNFARYQGMDLLFAGFEQALGEDPDLLLMCVGASESDRRSWMKALSPETAARVRIVPRCRRSEVPSFLALASCLVSLRPLSQNLPLKVFEYMGSGKPIVATRGPAHEPVLSARRAFLCDPTAASVAENILKVVQSPQRARAIAFEAKRYASHRFGWDAFVHFVKNVYDEALAPSDNYATQRAMTIN